MQKVCKRKKFGKNISERPARGFFYGLDVLSSLRDQAGKGADFVMGNNGAEIFPTKETNAKKTLAMVGVEFEHHITQEGNVKILMKGM